MEIRVAGEHHRERHHDAHRERDVAG